jgi:2-polyprenyl-3-methyl-5-hydroxy-6-metoxy-1,4-benzoquinol methylase
MSKKFNISHYDERYFKWHRDFTVNYIKKNMSWYVDEYSPTSVIDYGCGIGAYLETALEMGITKLLGFDIGGDNVSKYTSTKVQPYIEYIDCTLPIQTDRFDCVISLETGEHIETEKSNQFIENIVNSTSDGGTILFSAAQPGQNGSGHINCQTKEFWISIFGNYNFIVDIELTNYISNNWSKLGAPIYIKNNLIVFKKLLK